MSLDQETWAEIARLWLDGREPLGRIAARFAISHQKITARARIERWLPRGAGENGSASVTQPDGFRGAFDTEGGGGDAGRRAIGGAARQKNVSRKEHAATVHKPRRIRRRAGAHKAMVERLFDAMDVKLSAIEARIASGGDTTSADSERTTRALNTLIRSLEKLSDYEGKISKKAERNDGNRLQTSVDPEHRRHELARRIERLLKRR